MAMKSHKNMILKIPIALLIVFAVLIVLCGAYFVIQSKRSHQRLIHLLCETDYQLLLDACRKLSKRVSTGDLQAGAYWVRINREPSALQFQFPRVILDMEPVFVHADSEGWVMLEMGGIPTYGVVAYPKASMAGYSFRADIELIPGLWYYDEDYEGEYPEYKKKIDALIQKGKSRQIEKNMDSGEN